MSSFPNEMGQMLPSSKYENNSFVYNVWFSMILSTLQLLLICHQHNVANIDEVFSELQKSLVIVLKACVRICRKHLLIIHFIFML